MKMALLSHRGDNVATLLEDVSAEPVQLTGVAGLPPVLAIGRIERAHKIAVTSIGPGSPVIKYGVAIAIATAPIEAGEWVHLHNCRSQVDERSSRFAAGVESGSEQRYA